MSDTNMLTLPDTLEKYVFVQCVNQKLVVSFEKDNTKYFCKVFLFNDPPSSVITDFTRELFILKTIQNQLSGNDRFQEIVRHGNNFTGDTGFQTMIGSFILPDPFKEFLIKNDYKNEKIYNTKPEKLPYIITKEIKGETLSKWLAKQNEAIDVSVIKQIGFQLTFLTAKLQTELGIMHHDLHENNVFIETLDKEKDFYYVMDKKDVFVLNTKYVIRIFDFGSSSICLKNLESQETQHAWFIPSFVFLQSHAVPEYFIKPSYKKKFEADNYCIGYILLNLYSHNRLEHKNKKFQYIDFNETWMTFQFIPFIKQDLFLYTIKNYLSSFEYVLTKESLEEYNKEDQIQLKSEMMYRRLVHIQNQMKNDIPSSGLLTNKIIDVFKAHAHNDLWKILLDECDKAFLDFLKKLMLFDVTDRVCFGLTKSKGYSLCSALYHCIFADFEPIDTKNLIDVNMNPIQSMLFSVPRVVNLNDQKDKYISFLVDETGNFDSLYSSVYDIDPRIDQSKIQPDKRTPLKIPKQVFQQKASQGTQKIIKNFLDQINEIMTPNQLFRKWTEFEGAANDYFPVISNEKKNKCKNLADEILKFIFDNLDSFSDDKLQMYKYYFNPKFTNPLVSSYYKRINVDDEPGFELTYYNEENQTINYIMLCKSMLKLMLGLCFVAKQITFADIEKKFDEYSEPYLFSNKTRLDKKTERQILRITQQHEWITRLKRHLFLILNLFYATDEENQEFLDQINERVTDNDRITLRDNIYKYYDLHIYLLDTNEIIIYLKIFKFRFSNFETETLNTLENQTTKLQTNLTKIKQECDETIDLYIYINSIIIPLKKNFYQYLSIFGNMDNQSKFQIFIKKNYMYSDNNNDNNNIENTRNLQRQISVWSKFFLDFIAKVTAIREFSPTESKINIKNIAKHKEQLTKEYEADFLIFRDQTPEGKNQQLILEKFYKSFMQDAEKALNFEYKKIMKEIDNYKPDAILYVTNNDNTNDDKNAKNIAERIIQHFSVLREVIGNIKILEKGPDQSNFENNLISAMPDPDGNTDAYVDILWNNLKSLFSICYLAYPNANDPQTHRKTVRALLSEKIENLDKLKNNDQDKTLFEIGRIIELLEIFFQGVPNEKIAKYQLSPILLIIQYFGSIALWFRIFYFTYQKQIEMFMKIVNTKNPIFQTTWCIDSKTFSDKVHIPVHSFLMKRMLRQKGELIPEEIGKVSTGFIVVDENKKMMQLEFTYDERKDNVVLTNNTIQNLIIYTESMLYFIKNLNGLDEKEFRNYITGIETFTTNMNNAGNNVIESYFASDRWEKIKAEVEKL